MGSDHCPVELKLKQRRYSMVKVKQFFKMMIGLFLFGLGIVMTIEAGLGVAPWDVFHHGLSLTIGITMGQASIILGLLVVILDVVLGQDIGWGTVLNMLLIGIFMDILMLNNLVPTFESFIPNLIMLVLGIFVEGYGCYLYISVGYGAGPRDGLMVALAKRTGKSVRFLKSSIEVFAVTAGFLLGGHLGLGTLIMALFGGIIFQFAFKTVNFDLKSVDDIKWLKDKLNREEITIEEDRKNPL